MLFSVRPVCLIRLLFIRYSMQYSYLIQVTWRRGSPVLSAICHHLSSIRQLSSVGCSIFFIVANFSCTVLCNFHMDVYDFICCHKKCLKSVDRDYCAMENKRWKCSFCLKWFWNLLDNGNNKKRSDGVEMQWCGHGTREGELMYFYFALDGSKHLWMGSKANQRGKRFVCDHIKTWSDNTEPGI